MAEERYQPNKEIIETFEHESQHLSPETTPALCNLVEQELFKLRGNVTDTIDLINDKKIKIRAKISLAEDGHPDQAKPSNYAGRLLGNRGQNLKDLMDSTQTRMAILGQGSMRDADKEREALETGDSKYLHLKQPMYLQIDVSGESVDAYYRLSVAINKVKEILAEHKQHAANNMGGGGRGAPRGGPRGGGRGRDSFPRSGGYEGHGGQRQGGPPPAHYGSSQPRNSTGASGGGNGYYDYPSNEPNGTYGEPMGQYDNQNASGGGPMYSRDHGRGGRGGGDYRGGHRGGSRGSPYAPRGGRGSGRGRP